MTSPPRHTLNNGVASPFLRATRTTGTRRAIVPRKSLWVLLLVAFGMISLAFSWDNRVPPRNRRQVLHTLLGSALVASSTVTPFARPSLAQARNMPEPSTVDTSKAGTIETLVPVVKLERNLRELKSALQAGDYSAADLSTRLGGSIPTDEKAFKAIFDAYSDPVSYKQKFVEQNAFLVYYTKGFDGPNRPSIESDLPVKQTLQFGARNDAWVAWNDFYVELEFAKRDPASSEKSDLLDPLGKAVSALEDYVRQSPAGDLAKANAAASN